MVGAVALVATGAGAILGAAAAASTVVGGIASVATIASVASFAAGALSLAAGLTASKPNANATGSQTQFAADPDASIPIVLGRTGTSGNIVYRKGFDTKDSGDNDRQSFVSVLSLGPVKSVGGFTADKSPTGFNATGAAIGAFAGFMWSMTQLGALPEASAMGFGTGAGSPPGWTASHKLSGKAAASWTLRFDTKAKLFQNGVPEPMWVVEGMLCYDPRKDSTYPGGSGPHRMADPSDRAAYDAAVATWEYSENPYLWGLKWAHGIWQRDKTNPNSDWQRVMGMGAPQAAIDVAAFVEGANIADANGWKVGGVIYSGDAKWASFKKILQAGMGEPLTLGAKFSCLVNAPRVSLATITIDDVIGQASNAATQPRRNRINTITPRYRLEANHWELLPGPPISVPEHVAEDRGRRSKVQDYPFIQDTKQVATAVRYDIENAREFGPIVLPLKLVWMGYKPGDCVTATLPEIGLVNQPILLLNRDLEPASGVVTMTARSETAAKHPFALGQTTTPPPTPGVVGPPVVPVPGQTAWAISATSITSPDGTSKMPALVVTGAVDAGTPDAVVFEYRRFASGQAADANWIAAGVEPAATTRKEIVSLGSRANYEVAVSYRVRGVVGARRVIGPVTVGNLMPSDANGTSLEQLVSTAASQAASAAAAVAGFGDNSLLSPEEKKILRIEDQQLENAWSVLETKAATITDGGVASARSNASGKRSAWQSYRNGLNLSSTSATPVDRSTYQTRLNEWAASIQTLAEALRQYAEGRANSALSLVDAIVSEGKLSRLQKPALLKEWASIVAETPVLVAQAQARGISPAAYQQAQSALGSKLGSYSPPWNDTTQDTVLPDPAAFRQAFVDYYAAKATLLAAMDGNAKAQEDLSLMRVAQAASDGHLTPKEKADDEIDYQALKDRLDKLVLKCASFGNPAGVLSARDAAGGAIYQGQPNSLYTYLYGPADISNRNGNTAVVAATYEAKWKTAYQALTAFETALMGVLPAAQAEALADMVAISDDDGWSPFEKSTVLIPRDAALESAWSLLDGRAAGISGNAGVNSARSSATSARSAWQSYRNARSPTWNDTNQPTAIDRGTVRSLLLAYDAALVTLTDALRVATDSKAGAALDRLAVYDSDSVLAKGKKWQIVDFEWQPLNYKFNALNARYVALAYPSDITPYQADAYTKLQALASYLGGLTPQWDNALVDTPFDRSVWRTKWADAITAIETFNAAITGRKGDKGDPGAPGTGGGTRSPQTETFNGTYSGGGWHSAGIVVNMTPGQSIPMELRMSGFTGNASNGSATIYIQVMRASDNTLIQNFGPSSFSVPRTPANVGEGMAGEGSVTGTYTNNTGLTQNIKFWAHVSIGGLLNDAGSYLRV